MQLYLVEKVKAVAKLQVKGDAGSIEKPRIGEYVHSSNNNEIAHRAVFITEVKVDTTKEKPNMCVSSEGRARAAIIARIKRPRGSKKQLKMTRLEPVFLGEWCSGLWGKGITCATCVVLLLLPPLYEHFAHTDTSEIRHVTDPGCGHTKGGYNSIKKQHNNTLSSY
jgi:hypothetical protein